MSKYTLFLFLLCFGVLSAQEVSYTTEELIIKTLTDSISIDGTLLLANKTRKTPLAIIIQGSGPTDRNGNQSNLENNSLKFLAEGLYQNNISSFRYDKRMVKLVLEGKFKESDVDFNDFIADATSVIEYFNNDQRFYKIIIIGHSQGSLVGMIASKGRADAFISLAGAGQEIDDVIVDQIAKQAPIFKENARQAFDELRSNGVTRNYDPNLASIFRPSIQLFLLSWMQYNPQEELKKLAIPILIINGDNDLQVQISEAEKLKQAKPSAQLEIIPSMNHILKEIKGDITENHQSYTLENIPISPKLIATISTFILN